MELDCQREYVTSVSKRGNLRHKNIRKTEGNHHFISGHVIFETNNNNRREDGVFWEVYKVYRCSYFLVCFGLFPFPIF